MRNSSVFLADSPLQPVWRHIVAPLVIPVMMAPLMVPASFTWWGIILILTGLLKIGAWAAWAVVVVWNVYYYLHTAGLLEREHNIQLFLARMMTSVGWLVAFILCMIFLPDFQPVLRWFAAATISYYTTHVAIAFVQSFFLSPIEEFERNMREQEREPV